MLERDRRVDHHTEVCPRPAAVGIAVTQPGVMSRFESANDTGQGSGFGGEQNRFSRTTSRAYLLDQISVEQILTAQKLDGAHVAIITASEVIGRTPEDPLLIPEDAPHPVVDAV